MFLKETLLSKIQLLKQKSKDPFVFPVLLGPGKGLWIHSNQKLEKSDSLPSAKLKILSEVCKRGWTVWDYANPTGFSTILFSRIVGKEGLVVSFERDQKSFEKTYQNANLNACNNILFVFKKKSSKKSPYVMNLNDAYLDTELPIPNLIRFDLALEGIEILTHLKSIAQEQKPLLFIENCEASTLKPLAAFTEENFYHCKNISYNQEKCLLLIPQKR